MTLVPGETAVVGGPRPPQDATAKVTATPLTGLPLASCTITEGSTATAVPAVADCPLPALTAIALAAPAVPVAVNVTGLPVRPVDVAVRVFGPAVGPRVHDVTVAMPLGPAHTAAVGTTAPPPAATAKVTATPLTGLPLASCTITDGSTGTLMTRRPPRSTPLPYTTRFRSPAVPVAVNVTGLPVSPLDVAVRVFGPAVGPRVHDVTVAMPLAPVVTAVPGTTVPPPAATANATATPPTGLPLAARTITDGPGGTAVPDVADWLFP